MRKRIIAPIPQEATTLNEGWLGLVPPLSRSRRRRMAIPSSHAYSRVCLAMVSRWRDAHFEKLCANNGISVPRMQYGRPRNVRSNSQPARFLNLSLCQTSIGNVCRTTNNEHTQQAHPQSYGTSYRGPRIARYSGIKPLKRVYACREYPLPGSKLVVRNCAVWISEPRFPSACF